MVTVSTPVAWTFYPEKGSLTPRPDVPLWLMPATQAFTSASVANHLTTIVPAVAVAPAWALEAGTLVHSLFQIHSYVAVIAQLAGVGCGAAVLHLPTPSLIPLSPPPFLFFSLPVACCLLPLPHGLLPHAPPPLLIPELITPAILPASRDRLCNDPFLLFLVEKEQGSYRQHEHHVFAWRGSAVLTTQSQLDTIRWLRPVLATHWPVKWRSHLGDPKLVYFEPRTLSNSPTFLHELKPT